MKEEEYYTLPKFALFSIDTDLSCRYRQKDDNRIKRDSLRKCFSVINY